ncbi:unnamed protein product [Anisakis simplex]|uniref:DUF3987 domain-containing protein n=1 Tax=Anisakis simplex TaxID=6269 RepID=A0A0M3JFA0_ANISI|nr:unnamed protein product [Anisakis simplex]
MKFIIELLFETAELNGFDGNILAKLAEISVENGDVVEKWLKKIPPIERAVSVRHPLYERFMNVTIPERIYAQSNDNINGNENAMLAVWCISKDIVRSSKVEQLRVLIGYLKLIEMEKRATALLIAMYNFELIASLEERLRLLLQLISLSRVDGHSLKVSYCVN